MQNINVVVERLDPDAKLPTYAHGYEEDAGCDLYAIEDAYIPPTGVVCVRTGVKIMMPPGVQAEIRSKSGLATKGVFVVNSPGTVDPSYRGELIVILGCLRPVRTSDGYHISKGDKIAQIVFMPYLGADFVKGIVTNDSQRGEGGCGSTGK